MPGAICLLTTSRKEAVPARVACADSMSIYAFIDSSITMSSRPGRTTPFTRRVACKEHDVSKNRNLAFSVTCASPQPRSGLKCRHTPPQTMMRFDTAAPILPRRRTARQDHFRAWRRGVGRPVFSLLPAFFVGEGSGGEDMRRASARALSEEPPRCRSHSMCSQSPEHRSDGSADFCPRPWCGY